VTTPPFKFLTHAAFQQLSVDEKADYLIRAQEALKNLKKPGQLFTSAESGPPANPAEDREEKH
jgi:hypothetical protein